MSAKHKSLEDVHQAFENERFSPTVTVPVLGHAHTDGRRYGRVAAFGRQWKVGLEGKIYEQSTRRKFTTTT